MSLLEAKKVSKVYGCGENLLMAVDDVSICIETGEFLVIMGSSGSGKSSLLHLLSGLDKVSTGSIKFADIEISHMNDEQLARFRRKHVGFVFQDHSLIADLTLWQNIVVPGYLDKTVEVVNRYADKMVKEMDICEHINKYPKQVSGGQLQRAAISRALINQPDIVFCDEPTGNLDSKSKKRVLELLHEINRQGHTIIMVTHDIKDALYGSKVVYLKDGKIAETLCLIDGQPQSKESKQLMYDFLSRNGWLA